MILFALLLLGTRTMAVDYEETVPAGQFRLRSVPVSPDSTIELYAERVRGAGRMQLKLVATDAKVLGSVDCDESCQIRIRLRTKERYVLMLDNRYNKTMVRLHVMGSFTLHPTQVSVLPVTVRAMWMAASALFTIVICALFGPRVLGAIRSSSPAST